MKIKIKIKQLVLENTYNNFFTENYREIFAKVLESRGRSRVSQQEENSLLDLLQKESLLRSEKVEFLGKGGYQLAFSLGRTMVFKLFYSRDKRAKSAQARMYRQSYEKAHNIRYDKKEDDLLPKEKEDISVGNPGKMMVYSYGENEDWAYGITSKVVPGNKAFLGFEGEDENRELTHANKIPLDVLDILQDELDSYQDADALKASYVDAAGRTFAKTSNVVSEPQRLAREPITTSARKSREQVIKERAKILLQWFEGKYDIIRNLDGHTKNTIEDILEAYLEEASKGGTDFKLGNIGVTSNGKVAFFDPMYKQDFEGQGLVTQSISGRRIPRETRPHEQMVVPGEFDKKRKEQDKKTAQQRYTQFPEDYESRYNYPPSGHRPPIMLANNIGIADPNPIYGPRRRAAQAPQVPTAPTAQAPQINRQAPQVPTAPTAQAPQINRQAPQVPTAPTAQAPQINRQAAAPSQRARTRMIPQSRLDQLARQDLENAPTKATRLNENRIRLRFVKRIPD